jgi:hypothetical protein
MREEPTKKEAQIWADALRSGKFNKTKGSLENRNGHCCLGVACSIFIPKARLEKNNNFLTGWYPESQPAAPDWLRIINEGIREKLGVRLSSLNDTGNYTFDEIADIIELVYVHKALN